MEEQFIRRTTAFLAREKGLDFELDRGDNCTCYYIKKTEGFHEDYVTPYHVHSQFPDRKVYLFAPTQARLQRWLREKHNIQVYVHSHTKNGDGIYRDYVVYVNELTINDARDEEFQTYESALEVGLQTALEMI